MDNINYEDFKNICRFCITNCDTNFNKDSVILDTFHKLTDIHFDTNDELPQQICHKCLDFINEIHTFSVTCKQTHSVLMQCLNNHKNKGINEDPEQIKIEDEIEIEEHVIEYVKDELNNDCETNDPLKENVTESTNDSLPPISDNTKTENDEQLISVINYLNNKINASIGESSTNIISKRNKKKNYSTKHEDVTNIAENPYKCDQCEKSFTCVYNLKDHKLAHSGERPHKCDQCGKCFAKFRYMKDHKRVHSTERPFKCDQCDKCFIRAAPLNIHMRVHSGEKPFKCDQCGKLFRQLGNLKSHKRVHSGERPYKCQQCQKSFVFPNDLLRHNKNVHSSGPPFKCDQ